jgi:hypothetical protein
MAILSRNAPSIGLALVALAFAAPVAAQQPAPAAPAAAAPAPAPADPEITSFAKAFLAVGLVRDDFNAQLALPKNKTVELQAEIRKQMKEKVEEAIRTNGLTVDGYRRLEYQVTVDPTRRATFDRLITELQRG